MAATPQKRSREDNVSSSTDTIASLAQQLQSIGVQEVKNAASNTTSPSPKYSAAFRSCLDRIAAFLLTRVHIKAGDTLFTICEVEMYAKLDGVYEDRFTHCDTQQGLTGTWYFHKKGGTYKAGSFKGLDITFGTAAAGIWCGALIRSIQNVATKEDIEGPSLTVDTILKATQSASIAALVGGGADTYLLTENVTLGDEVSKDAKFEPKFCLVPCSTSSDTAVVLSAPRVGLVPRSLEDMSYAGRLLRFFLSGTKLKKQRSGVVAALLAEGSRSDDDVVKVSGCQKKMVGEIKAAMASCDPQACLAADVMQTPVIAAIVGYAQKINAL